MESPKLKTGSGNGGCGGAVWNRSLRKSGEGWEAAEKKGQTPYPLFFESGFRDKAYINTTTIIASVKVKLIV
jgi:hypothetical protein